MTLPLCCYGGDDAPHAGSAQFATSSRAPVDDEPRAPERRAFDMRRAAVPLDDPLDDCEPEAEAGLLAGRRAELHEGTEYALTICFGDAGSVVLDAQAIALLRDDGERHADLVRGVTKSVV